MPSAIWRPCCPGRVELTYIMAGISDYVHTFIYMRDVNTPPSPNTGNGGTISSNFILLVHHMSLHKIPPTGIVLTITITHDFFKCRRLGTIVVEFHEYRMMALVQIMAWL